MSRKFLGLKFEDTTAHYTWSVDLVNIHNKEGNIYRFLEKTGIRYKIQVEQELK